MKKNKNPQGKLYIVPTPIGNLSDITQRALNILQYVNVIAVENIYHANLLLRYFAINNTSLFSLNKHNERKKSKVLISKLQEGKNIALISNAGTPLINDPGYYLVRTCHEHSIRVIPLPGPCAVITALSASGLSTNRFYYEGFLPTKSSERCNTLNHLKNEPHTLIFCESTHRLLESLNDMIAILGSSRYVVLARELTKIWETIQRGPIGELFLWLKEAEHRRKGEIVLIVEGCKKEVEILPTKEILHTLSLLKNELPPKKAFILAAKIHKVKRNTLYKYVLEKMK